MAKTDGRHAPRKQYPPKWLRLFSVLDPEHEAPALLLEEIDINGTDLGRLVKGQSIHISKLLRLRNFCLLHGVPLPLEKSHPAKAALDAVEQAEGTKTRYAALLRRAAKP